MLCQSAKKPVKAEEAMTSSPETVELARKENQMELFLELFKRFQVSCRYFRAIIGRILTRFCYFDRFEMASSTWEMLDNPLKPKVFRRLLGTFVFRRMKKAVTELVRTRRIDRVRFPIISSFNGSDEMCVTWILGGFKEEGLDEMIRDLMIENLKEERSEVSTDLGRLKIVMKEWWDGLNDDDRPLVVPRFTLWNWWENSEDWKEKYCKGIRGFMGCI